MFSFKSKLSSQLKDCLDSNLYIKYRVLINYKNFNKTILDKISGFKNATLHSVNDYINIISCTLTKNHIEKLCEYPETICICLDDLCFISYSLSNSNHGSSIKNANYLKTNYNLDFSGRGISIGLIDTGVYPHNDLSNPSKIKLFKDLINDYTYPYDDNGHGTFLSGVICGSGLGSKGVYDGIAKGSDICCVKAFDSNGRGFCSDILYAIDYLIQESTSNNIRILCIPCELLCHNTFILSLFDKIFKKAILNNLIPIVSSGSNSYKDGIIGIGLLDSCLTVSGMDTSKGGYKPCDLSSYGPTLSKTQKPTITAACKDISSLSTIKSFIPERNGTKLYPPLLDTPYTTITSTSISCAYICACCSLILEKKPSLKFKDLLNLCQLCCKDVIDSKNIQGYGVLDISSILFNL